VADLNAAMKAESPASGCSRTTRTERSRVRRRTFFRALTRRSARRRHSIAARAPPFARSLAGVPRWMPRELGAPPATPPAPGGHRGGGCDPRRSSVTLDTTRGIDRAGGPGDQTPSSWRVAGCGSRQASPPSPRRCPRSMMTGLYPRSRPARERPLPPPASPCERLRSAGYRGGVRVVVRARTALASLGSADDNEAAGKLWLSGAADDGACAADLVAGAERPLFL
jgi:hypothetical protein